MIASRLLAGGTALADEHLERVREAVAALTAAELERYLAITDAVSAGHSNAEVGRTAGVTGSRISQIIKNGTGPGPERAFWDTSTDDMVTIAVGEKTEAPKPTGESGPVISAEARDAWDTLRRIAEAGLLETTYEPIAPPGFVALNRHGLLVVCGPRLSPQIADILPANDEIVFDHDEDGWFLVDTVAGKGWRSPQENGQPADIGLLARLPRPDQHGNFLYIGGLHSGGTSGAAHYLAANLPELWRTTGTKRFSALIGCDLDPSKHRAISSELLAGPYIHEK
jgi:hypothetical protein